MLYIVDINKLFVRLNRARQQFQGRQEGDFGRPRSSQPDLDLAGPEPRQRGQGMIVGDRRQLGQGLFVSLQPQSH